MLAKVTVFCLTFFITILNYSSDYMKVQCFVKKVFERSQLFLKDEVKSCPFKSYCCSYA